MQPEFVELIGLSGKFSTCADGSDAAAPKQSAFLSRALKGAFSGNEIHCLPTEPATGSFLRMHGNADLDAQAFLRILAEVSS